MIAAVLCTGPSLTAEQVEAVRVLPIVVAVNNAYQLAPWAHALAAIDARWWSVYPEAKQFAGRKFSANRIDGVEQMIRQGHLQSDTCSGVIGLEAAKLLGATRVLMLGLDFKGSHYFGHYPSPLSKTPPHQWAVHRRQFGFWRKHNTDVEVVNCSPGTALDVFPTADLHACLAQSALFQR